MHIKNKYLRCVLEFFGVIKVMTLEEEMIEIEKEILSRFGSLEKFNDFMNGINTNVEAPTNTINHDNHSNGNYSNNNNYNDYNSYNEYECEYDYDDSHEVLKSANFDYDYDNLYSNDIDIALHSSFNNDDDDSHNNYYYDDYSSHESYPLYEVDNDTTCYNNYNDSSYDYSSYNYWDN